MIEGEGLTDLVTGSKHGGPAERGEGKETRWPLCGVFLRTFLHEDGVLALVQETLASRVENHHLCREEALRSSDTCDTGNIYLTLATTTAGGGVAPI